MTELASNRVFTTSQLAEKLGIGPSMARRYGLALETITGQPLPQAPGKGRMYPEQMVKVLEEARQRLFTHPDETVEKALRTVLNIEEPEPRDETEPSQPPEPRLTAQQLKQELEQALHPLLAELHALKQDNLELRKEIQGLKALPAPEGSLRLEQRVAELEKRNQALRAALEAKEREEQERNRPWWRLWQRKKPTLGGG